MFWKFEPYLYYHFISYCATPQYGGIIPYMNLYWRRKIWRIGIPPAFLPRPLLRAGNQPRQSEKSFPPEKRFSLCRVRIEAPRTARILGGQNPERKTPFPFSKEISPPPNQKCKECFSFGVAGVLASAWGFLIRSVSARKRFAQSV